MNASIVGGLIGALSTICAVLLTRWSIRKAGERNAEVLERAKAMQVEAEVFQRSRAHLDDVIAQQNLLLSRHDAAMQRFQEEIAYLERQMRRVQELVEADQSATDSLRQQVRALTHHFEQRKDPLAELRNGGLPPAWPQRGPVQ